MIIPRVQLYLTNLEGEGSNSAQVRLNICEGENIWKWARFGIRLGLRKMWAYFENNGLINKTTYDSRLL